MLEAIKKGKKAARYVWLLSVFQTLAASNEARVTHHWLS